jgi:hypothetical protein
MRNKGKTRPLRLAPGAAVAVAQLYEINRPLKLVFPTLPLDTPAGSIDHHDRSGTQQWVHRAVPETDVTVHVPTGIAVPQERCRNLPPEGYHPIHELCGLPTKRGVETNRQRHLGIEAIDLG